MALAHESRTENFNTTARLAHADDFVTAIFKAARPTVRNSLVAVNIDFRSDFRKAFENVAANGIRGKGEGLLLKYSFHDTKKESWGSPIENWGTAPWDDLLEDDTKYRNVPDDEVRTITIAIDQGIMTGIPRNVHYISPGPGENRSFNAKDKLVIDALVERGHVLMGATTIDRNNRYAVDAAKTIYDSYGCDSTALHADFVARGFPYIQIAPGATPVIGMFGITMQNMPRTNGHTPEEEIVSFLNSIMMVLPNSHILMAVDTTPKDVDPSIAISSYEYSRKIELFALNFMAHAKEEGIITDPNYNILGHWKIIDPVWQSDAANLWMEAKDDHPLPTIDGIHNIKKGERVSVSRSAKGPIEKHVGLFKEAGYHAKAYPQQSTTNQQGIAKFIIHAQP